MYVYAHKMLEDLPSIKSLAETAASHLSAATCREVVLLSRGSWITPFCWYLSEIVPGIVLKLDTPTSLRTKKNHENLLLIDSHVRVPSKLQNMDRLRFELGKTVIENLAAAESMYSSIHPEDDGRTHLNVYSRARTPLGRFLSNWTYLSAPLKTEDGDFHTIEGYWFFLKTAAGNQASEALRTMTGAKAKDFPKTFPGEHVARCSPEDFRRKIRDAILAKLQSREAEAFMPQLARLDLPMRHYYVYGESAVAGDELWVIDFLTSIQTAMRTGVLPR